MRRTLCISMIFLLLPLATRAGSSGEKPFQSTADIEVSIDIAFGSEKFGTQPSQLMRCAEDSPCAEAEQVLPLRPSPSSSEASDVIGLVPIPFLGVVAIGLLLLISLTPSGRGTRRRNY